MKKLILSLCFGALMGVIGTSCSTEEALQNPEPVNDNGVRTVITPIPYRVLTTTWYNLNDINPAELLIFTNERQFNPYYYGPINAASKLYPPPVNFSTEMVLLAHAMARYGTTAEIAAYGINEYNGREMTVNVTKPPFITSPPMFTRWVVAIVVPKEKVGNLYGINLVINEFDF
jgi:hypothetical protein